MDKFLAINKGTPLFNIDTTPSNGVSFSLSPFLFSLPPPPSFLFLVLPLSILYSYWLAGGVIEYYLDCWRELYFPNGYIFPNRAALRENMVTRENITPFSPKNVIYPCQSITVILVSIDCFDFLSCPKCLIFFGDNQNFRKRKAKKKKKKKPE